MDDFSGIQFFWRPAENECEYIYINHYDSGISKKDEADSIRSLSSPYRYRFDIGDVYFSLGVFDAKCIGTSFAQLEKIEI